MEITAESSETMRRLFISDGDSFNFMMSSKEYLYFVYSNGYLPISDQDITITVTIETLFIMQSVPRVLFRLCSYEDPESCYLTSEEAVSSSMDMTVSQGVVVGDESTTVRTRVSTISHSPASCPQSMTSSTSRCHYLISLYNPNNYGPVKVSLRIDSSSTSSKVIQLSGGIGTKYTG